MCHAKGYGFLAILVWNRESISTADVFPVVTNTRTKSNQKQVKSINVDKIGSKKHLASKSVLFRVELIASSFLNLIFKQVRLNTALSGFLLLFGTGCPFRQEKSLKPGGGVLSHISHIGICRPIGESFWAVLVWKRVYTFPIFGNWVSRELWECKNIFIVSILNKKEREIWEFETNLRNFFCLRSE